MRVDCCIIQECNVVCLHYSVLEYVLEEKLLELLKSLCLLARVYCDIYGQFEVRTKNVALPATRKFKARI